MNEQLSLSLNLIVYAKMIDSRRYHFSICFTFLTSKVRIIFIFISYLDFYELVISFD